MPEMPETSNKRSRRGTNVRQRQHQVGVRLLPEELEMLQSLAERYGVSPAEVLRRAIHSLSDSQKAKFGTS